MDAPNVPPQTGAHRLPLPRTKRPDDDPLLGSDEPAAFDILNDGSETPLLLVCDHASRRIPRRLGTLGLTEDALARHIAYDIGAADLTRRLARLLDATAVLAGYSRLVIDCNRQPGDPQSIVEQSDGTFIPGNHNLTPEDQEARAEAILWPYHHAIDQQFARLRRTGVEPLFFSVHTFTPKLGDDQRTWDAGVLWNRDPRLAVPLLDRLRCEKNLCIGDNEPYSGRDIAYTLNLHAGSAGLAHAAIEVRQDHCQNTCELDRWAALLTDVLRQLLAFGNLHRIEYF